MGEDCSDHQAVAYDDQPASLFFPAPVRHAEQVQVVRGAVSRDFRDGNPVVNLVESSITFLSCKMALLLCGLPSPDWEWFQV